MSLFSQHMLILFFVVVVFCVLFFSLGYLIEMLVQFCNLYGVFPQT